MKRERRKFSKEFKEEAVRLMSKEGRTVASVARGLGIHETLLHRWKAAYNANGSDSFPGKGNLHPKDEEFRKLKHELADVKEERDILKKAVAIFSACPK